MEKTMPEHPFGNALDPNQLAWVPPANIGPGALRITGRNPRRADEPRIFSPAAPPYDGLALVRDLARRQE